RTVILSDKLNEKFNSDSISSIQLTNYQPNKLTYKLNVQSPKIAVFSEIYYPHGWTVKVDGKEREILKANYFLRAITLEKGDKEIVMEFSPQSVKTGNLMTMAFNVIFVLLVLGGGFYGWKNR